jgi:hypothetical protein
LEQPPGNSRNEARETKERETMEKRSVRQERLQTRNLGNTLMTFTERVSRCFGTLSAITELRGEYYIA